VSKTNVTYVAIIVNDAFNFAMIRKERSFVSKNSNSLNGMIKKTSMTLTNENLRKISAITTAIVMLSAVGTLGFSPIDEAFAKKPGSDTEGPISWSNGFPSGPHSNVNIHGKKLSFNCDNDGKPNADFGKSVFVPLNTTAARDANQAPTNIDNATIGDINFVSNKRSNIENAIVRDPCSAPFGNVTASSTGDNSTAALVELPPGEHQVYWRILGNHGGGPNKDVSEATISHPALLDTCDFLPTQYTDGSVVQWFDPDCTDCDTVGSQSLTNFVNGTEMYENSTGTTAGFSLTETIYSKGIGIANAVEIGDMRITNANNTSWDYTNGDSVDGASSPTLGNDLGENLFNFTNNFMYNDTDTSFDFSLDETVYNDVDDSDSITPGDIRVANAASVGLDETAGGDLLTCEDSEQLVGLGLVSNKGVFDLEDDTTLVRFGDSDNTHDKGQGNKKGKSNAINMTGLFQWSGSVCEAAELDGNSDNKLTFADFDLVDQDGLLFPDGNITSIDLDYLNNTLGFVIDSTTITDAEDLIHGLGLGNDGIEPDEFDVWIEYALASLEDTEGNLLCRYYESEWVFNVADIVLFGFDYENKGSSLTQLRFYPTDTTSYTEE
jgi:hypothetical protein